MGRNNFEKGQSTRKVRKNIGLTDRRKDSKNTKVVSRIITSREKTLRRLESNERERMRMHDLNDAFQVHLLSIT